MIPLLRVTGKCGRHVIISFECVPTCQLLWVDASWCKQSTEHKIQIIHLTLYPRPKKTDYFSKDISLTVFLANVLLLSGYVCVCIYIYIYMQQLTLWASNGQASLMGNLLSRKATGLVLHARSFPGYSEPFKKSLLLFTKRSTNVRN